MPGDTEADIQYQILSLFGERGFSLGTAQEDANVRLARLVNEVMSGQRTVEGIGRALDGGEEGGGTVETTRPEEDKATTGVGGGGADPATQLTILTGEEMRWFFDTQAGKWYVSYGLPESDRRLLFEADPDQMDALFGDNQRPSTFAEKTLNELVSNGRVTFGGNIGQMEGTGTFESEVRRVKTLALDNGALPDWANSTGEVMDLIYIADVEQKSSEWLIDQISKTQGFKTRFPSIEKIRKAGNLTMEQAITGFLEFEAGVKSSIKATGGQESAVSPEVIGGLLDKGFNLETVTTSIAKFDRMQNYKPAMEAFNRVLVEQGLQPISTLSDQFDFLSGTAPAEVYDLWEASSVSEAATAAGLGDVFTAEDAMKFAVETEGQTSLSDATGAFQSAATLLLRFRNEVDIGKFGLNTEDIIDLSLGRPPGSGTSAADLQENMNRAVLSAQANLRGRAKPFVRFGADGTPKVASLGNLREQQ